MPLLHVEHLAQKPTEDTVKRVTPAAAHRKRKERKEEAVPAKKATVTPAAVDRREREEKTAPVKKAAMTPKPQTGEPCT
eukprot:1161765-Pelagomonas_calceolata.AAC.15